MELYKHYTCHYLCKTAGGEEVASPLTIAVLKAKADGKKHITVWKKCDRTKKRWPGYDSTSHSIVELRVPITAAMRQPDGKKCRASKAEVVAIYDCHYVNDSRARGRIGPRSKRKVAYAHYKKSFIYKVGEVVKPDEPFDKGNETCSSGIHFFLTPEEAASYHF